MKFFPSAEEERWRAVIDLAGPSELARARAGEWRSFALLPRIGFFFLGSLCAGALLGMIELFGGHWGGIAVAGVLSLAAAELLMIGAKWFRAGVEEALHLWGIAMLFGAFLPFGSHEKTLFFTAAVALLIAAMRLLNPILLPLSVVCFAAATTEIAGACICAAAGAIALGVLPIRVARPSIDRMIASLVITMPVAAYGFAKGGKFEALDWSVAIALLAYSIAALGVGVRVRLHAPLIAIFVTLAAFAFEVRNVTGMRVEMRLIVWGALLLASAVVLERLLRTPRNGITSEKLRDDNILGLLELAGAAVLTPRAEPPAAAAPQLQPGGGAYGGGGATGDF